MNNPRKDSSMEIFKGTLTEIILLTALVFVAMAITVIKVW